VYHITSRGDGREPIALDDVDRSAFIDVLAHALERFDAQPWAYCLMDNHYHLVLHTSQATTRIAHSYRGRRGNFVFWERPLPKFGFAFKDSGSNPKNPGRRVGRQWE